MRKLTIIVLLFLSISSRAQVPREILSSVFYFKYQDKTGTSFITSIKKKDYLITSRHIFPDSLKHNTALVVEIFRNNKWEKINCNLLIHDNKQIDIAVLDLHTSIVIEYDIDFGSKDFFLSQDCFFLGFPFGIKMDDNYNLNNGFPIPLVKKGIISAFFNDTSGAYIILLDGHNNPGFSGGPVVTIHQEKNNYKARIIGVISSYVNESKAINTPFGKIISKENSGIIITFGSDHIYEIINTN